MAEETRHAYRFGPFELDVPRMRLLRGGKPLAVPPKMFDLLLLLVENRGRLIEKSELMDRLWPDTTVDEANLSQQIFMLRKMLGEQSSGRPYIETMSRRGYVFIAEVQEIVGSETLPHPAAAPRTVAVLPFRPLSSGPIDEYLALGMADAVITPLAQIGGLIVRPTSSVLKYAGSSVDPIAAGGELDVELLLEGRFQRVGNRVRVSAQLIHVRDRSSIWAQNFDAPYDDVFTVQDAISERVAAALAENLSRRDRERLTRRYTENIEAYHLYLRGRYFAERGTIESLLKSLEYYQQAIANDPAYALAHAGLADTYNILGNFSVLPPGEAYPKANAAAARALEIDPGLAQAEIARALATYLYDRDWEVSERGLKRALADAPNYAPGHQWYAVCLLSRGRSSEAVAEIRRALEIDPLSLVINSAAGWIYYLNRDYEAAIDATKRTLDMEASFPFAHTYLGMTYAAQGKYREAEKETRQGIALRKKGGVDRDLGLLGLILARAGQTAEARQVLEELQHRARDDYVSPYPEALVHLGLEEKSEALTLLERAAEQHDPWVIHYNVEPALDSLRQEPRFKALLRRIGIPEVNRDGQTAGADGRSSSE